MCEDAGRNYIKSADTKRAGTGNVDTESENTGSVNIESAAVVVR